MIEAFFSYTGTVTTSKKAIVAKNRFAVVTEIGTKRCSDDFVSISARTQLSPIFISLSYGDAFRVARGMSRKLGAPISIPECFEDFKRAIESSAFSVCDGIHGAFLSLLSHTPTYLDVERRDAREMIATFTAASVERAVLLPYERSRMHKIKKVGVRDSDFISVFKNAQQNIEAEIDFNLNPLP